MQKSTTEPTINDPLRAGRAALARGAWKEARACFEAAVRGEETPQALEGLGLAAWWLDDADTTFAARLPHAYRARRATIGVGNNDSPISIS
jgi:LuxR family transcriptional regulator, maltose regulon positive regulatory protein